jgi:hypothetical protein
VPLFQGLFCVEISEFLYYSTTGCCREAKPYNIFEGLSS